MFQFFSPFYYEFFFFFFLNFTFLSFIMGEGSICGSISWLFLYPILYILKKITYPLCIYQFLIDKNVCFWQKISLAFAIQGLVSLCDGVITALPAINVKMQDTCVRYVKTIVMIFFFFCFNCECKYLMGWTLGLFTQRSAQEPSLEPVVNRSLDIVYFIMSHHYGTKYLWTCQDLFLTLYIEFMSIIIVVIIFCGVLFVFCPCQCQAFMPSGEFQFHDGHGWKNKASNGIIPSTQD